MAEPLSLLFALALTVFLIYFVYGRIRNAFRAVGFTEREAGLIVLGGVLLGAINIPIGTFNGWRLAINVGGAIIPIVVAWLLLQRYPGVVEEALIGIPLVALVTYLVTDVTPRGIVSTFPWFLAPPLAAALLSLAAFWREDEHAAPLAYINGSLGALIGADVLRIQEFIAQPPPSDGGVASIGGAAIFDMVFLAGVIAVLMDMWIFRQVRREEHEEVFPSPGGDNEVFTPTNPPHGHARSPLGNLTASRMAPQRQGGRQSSRMEELQERVRPADEY